MPKPAQTGLDQPSVDNRTRWKGVSKSKPNSVQRIVHVSYDVVNQLLDEPPVSDPGSGAPLFPSPPPLSSSSASSSSSSSPSISLSNLERSQSEIRPTATRRARLESTWSWLLISVMAGAILALAVFRALGILPVSAAAMQAEKIVVLKPLLAEPRLLEKQNDVADPALFAQLPADLSLGSYVSQFARLTNIPISVDVDTLRYSRATLETTIAPNPIATSRGSTLSTFAATLKPFDLKCFASNDQVVIRGVADDRQLRHAMHDVSDLLPESGGGLDLVTFVRQFVDPDSWQGNGGSGTISLNGDVLSIHNTSRVHRDVLVACETLRRTRGLPMVSQVDVRPAISSVRDELRRLNSIQVHIYSDQPCRLTDLLAVLEKSCGYTFLVNWQAIEQAMPLRFETCQVALNAGQMNLREALSRMVTQLGLTFRSVGPHIIEITSIAEELRQECIMAQRLPQGFDPAEFTEEVQAEFVSALPDSGDRFYVDATSASMIARLPQSRQVRLAEWLEFACTRP